MTKIEQKMHQSILKYSFVLNHQGSSLSVGEELKPINVVFTINVNRRMNCKNMMLLYYVREEPGSTAFSYNFVSTSY